MVNFMSLNYDWYSFKMCYNSNSWKWKKKIIFPVQNVQIRQYCMPLACGCIIGAQLSHWHGSNLCLQALKSAVTGWNNNCALWKLQWVTAEGDGSVSQDKLTARKKLNIREESLNRHPFNWGIFHIKPKIYQTSQTLRMPKQSMELTCPQPGALHTKGRSSPIFANSLQCNCGRGAEENIVAASPQFVDWYILKTTK